MEVTFQGEPIQVKGTQPKIGDQAPNATVYNHKGEAVELKDVLEAKTTILSVIPNVLSRTCELQTKRFSEETANKGYQYITVGRNTVEEFNQWNKENGLDVDTYTDQDGEFGKAYGLEIDLGGDIRTARAVFVIDKDGLIQYEEIVEEVANEPNYEAALEAADNA